VNSRAEERTSLIGGKEEEDGVDNVERSTTTTTHMRLIGKGEQVHVEVT
jgi:hypothetical protein